MLNSTEHGIYAVHKCKEMLAFKQFVQNRRLSLCEQENIYVQVNNLARAVEHIMSRPGFSEFQKSICKFVPNFIRICVRDDPYLCWQNIGAGKYRAIRRVRPFSAHFQTKADMAW